MSIKKIQQHKYLFSVALILGLIVPVFDANALSLFGFEDIGYWAINKFFAVSLSIMFTVIGKLLALMVVMLSWVVNLRIYTNVPIIQESWRIMRDFANMLFIIALIVMAYGTIFNIRGYDFRSLLPRFIVIAFIINFSLVIGGVIIDATQVLNNTFLNAMGDIAGRLGDGLNPSQILPKSLGDISDSEAIANVLAGSIITLVFSIFLLFTFAISVAVPLAVALVRIPILWALLIISPLAWLLSILPATKKAWDNWWHHFLAWNLFLPYYLFFLYFALYFLSKKDEVIQGLGQDFVYSGLTGLQSNFTFGLIFYYAMVALFMIWGTKVAMNAGRFSGAGIVSVAKWSRGAAMRRLGVTSTQRAAMQRLGEIQKEGLPGRFGVLYGGERGLERDTAKWAERFGVVGAKEKQIAGEIGALKSRFERITDPEQLRSLMGKGRIQEQLAVREIMKNRGLLNSSELLETYELYGGSTSLAGKQFARSVDYNKLSPTERERWLQATRTDVESQQKIYGVMADKGDDYIRSEQNINRALSLMVLEGDQRDFLKKIEKYELETATRIQMEKGFLRDAVGVIENDMDRALRVVVGRMNPDAILEASRTISRNAAVGNIVAETLNKQKIESLLSKGTEQQLSSLMSNDAIRTKIEEHRNASEETARRQAETTARAVEEGVRRGLGGGGVPPAGGGQPPQGQPSRTGRGSGNYPRGQVGFGRPDEVAQEGNVVDLRNRDNQ